MTAMLDRFSYACMHRHTNTVAMIEIKRIEFNKIEICSLNSLYIIAINLFPYNQLIYTRICVYTHYRRIDAHLYGGGHVDSAVSVTSDDIGSLQLYLSITM